jgi:aspartate 1-decarboxylase
MVFGVWCETGGIIARERRMSVGQAASLSVEEIGVKRTMLKSKIHRATVTEANLEYEGSLTIDEDLLEAADILPNEQVHVWDVTNGTRLVTYALVGKRGSGAICVNGAGARLIKPGDIIIIATYTAMKNRPARKHKPIVVFVDERNRAKKE